MSLETGARLAHYEILGPLGRGGMGQVYRARDTKLDREVALKLLPAELSGDPRRLQRLEQEARTLARLNHPNIVTIHSVEEADGRRFLTMEKVEGETLDRRIGRDGLAVEALVELAVPLTEAVAAAHEQGIVHRDLKPANVMVTADGTVKVLDFGLAKVELPDAGAPSPADETATSIQPVTDAGTVMGTAAYMSPEQARGEPVDARSDIFSLGILLYQMATGRLPFGGATPADTVSAILRDSPPSVTELKPDLPNHLGRLIRRCLEKDPSRRLQSARDLSLEMRGLGQELASGEIAAARPRASGKWIAGIAVVALVALAAWWASRPPDAPVVAESQTIVVFPFESLGPAEDAYFAIGIADEIGSRLARVGSLGVISRASAMQYDRTGKTMAVIGEELGVDFVLDGTVRWARSGTGPAQVRVTPQLIRVADDHTLWSSSFNETLEEIFDVQSRIAEQVIAELDLKLNADEQQSVTARSTDSPEAYEAYLRALENRAMGTYSPDHRLETIRLLQRAVELDPEFARAWSVLSEEHSYYYHLRYDTTDERRRLARSAVDRALEIDPDLPEAHLALGLYHYRCHRDYDRALVELSIAARGLPNQAELLLSIAAVRRRLGEFEASADVHERALRLAPRDATATWDLGVTYALLGRYDEAISRTDRAIEIAPRSAPAFLLKTYVYTLLGDLASAGRALDAMPPSDSPFAAWVRFSQLKFRRDYEAAMQHIRGVGWEVLDHTTFHAPRWQLIGDLERLRGNHEAARAAYAAALETVDRSLKDRSDDARIHLARGIALAGLGRREEAIAAGRHGVELYPTSLDAFHGPHMEGHLVRIYLMTGDYEQALDRVEALLAGPQKSVFSVPYLRLDPDFDVVRELPRFEQLLVQYDLPR